MPTQEQLDQFKGYVTSGDPSQYSKAAELGRSLGYNDNDIAWYTNTLIPNSYDNVKSYLSQTVTPSSQSSLDMGPKQNTAYVPPVKPTTPAPTEIPWKTPPATQEINYAAPSTTPDRSIYNADGTLKGATQYTLPALQGNGQYSNAMQVATANPVNPTLGAVNPNATASKQLYDFTSKDSPTMQLARQKGLLVSADRGLLNSSDAAGSAMAAMVSAAQPYALQDAQTYNNQDLTNQAASNQFKMAGYQTGLNNVNQTYVANNTAANTAALAPILTASQIQQQQLGALDAQKLAGLQNQYSKDQTNNAAIATQQTNFQQQYNDYLVRNGLQDSSQAFSRWQTEANNANQLQQTAMNNAASIENTNTQARVTSQGQLLNYDSNKYSTDATYRTNVNQQLVSLAGTQSNAIQQILTNTNVKDTDKFQAIFQLLSPLINANNAVGGPPMTAGDMMISLAQNATMAGITMDGKVISSFTASDWQKYFSQANPISAAFFKDSPLAKAA